MRNGIKISCYNPFLQVEWISDGEFHIQGLTPVPIMYVTLDKSLTSPGLILSVVKWEQVPSYTAAMCGVRFLEGSRPRPEIKPRPQQQPKPLQRQHELLNLLNHERTPTPFSTDVFNTVTPLTTVGSQRHCTTCSKNTVLRAWHP